MRKIPEKQMAQTERDAARILIIGIGTLTACAMQALSIALVFGHSTIWRTGALICGVVCLILQRNHWAWAVEARRVVKRLREATDSVETHERRFAELDRRQRELWGERRRIQKRQQRLLERAAQLHLPGLPDTIQQLLETGRETRAQEFLELAERHRELLRSAQSFGIIVETLGAIQENRIAAARAMVWQAGVRHELVGSAERLLGTGITKDIRNLIDANRFAEARALIEERAAAAARRRRVEELSGRVDRARPEHRGELVPLLAQTYATTGASDRAFRQAAYELEKALERVGV